MTTINLKHKRIGSTDWSQDSDHTVQVINNWQAIWHEYCAFIANSVLIFSQNTRHREIIDEVKSLCTNHITDKAAWLLVASKARLAASEAAELDLDEESRAAVLTALAIAHLALSSDKKWLERASSMSIHAIAEGWSAYAFGCSKAIVAKIASQKAIAELTSIASELLTAVQPMAKVA